MKCKEVLDQLKVLSPVQFAMDWDNVGLLIGCEEKNIHAVYLAVDATDEVIEDAIKVRADLLLTHHPLIFHSLKSVTNQDFIGRRILKLIQEDLCYVAMHTNFDVLGMADAAAEEVGLKNPQVLSVTYEDEISKEGIGRYGTLEMTTSLENLAEFIKETFHLSSVRVYGDLSRFIEKAAIVPGSGSSCIMDAIQVGADVLITGDIDHHDGIDAVAQGITIIDAGHYGIEKIFVPYMKDFFKKNMPEIQIYEAPDISPFTVI